MAWYFRDFNERRGLTPKVKMFELGYALSKLEHLKHITGVSLGAKLLAAG